MAKEVLPRWLVRRGGLIYYVRRVPERYAALDDRRIVRVSLGTDNVAQAIVARDDVNRQTEAYWIDLARGSGPTAKEKYEAAIAFARRMGFSYRTTEEIAEGDFQSLVKRIATLEAELSTPALGRSKAKRETATRGLLGLAVEPGFRLSNLVETFETMSADERRGMSADQVHKWRLPRTRAVKSLIEAIGDKPLEEIERQDAIAFRDAWSRRILGKGRSPESANKDMAYLGRMISAVSDRYALDLKRQFSGLTFRAEGTSPPPYTPDFIRDMLLSAGALDGLNATARGIVLMMIETGARPGELAHLRPEDIRLDHEIPHISIEPQADHRLKTRFSKREMPLVGVAIDGARLYLTSSGRYRGRGGALSATISKYLEANGLKESDRHTLYSLRHGFKDRLTAASALDIVDAALMGHKFHRPTYGSGVDLALKLQWIERIAVSIERPAVHASAPTSE